MFDMSYVYTIYKPFVSPGSVQQIMPYWLWLKPLRIMLIPARLK
jgi:hypothetical protein